MQPALGWEPRLRGLCFVPQPGHCLLVWPCPVARQGGVGSVHSRARGPTACPMGPTHVASFSWAWGLPASTPRSEPAHGPSRLSAGLQRSSVDPRPANQRPLQASPMAHGHSLLPAGPLRKFSLGGIRVSERPLEIACPVREQRARPLSAGPTSARGRAAPGPTQCSLEPRPWASRAVPRRSPNAQRPCLGR